MKIHRYELLVIVLVIQVRGKMLDPGSRSVRLSKLSSNTRYLICVMGLGNWLSRDDKKQSPIGQFNASKDDVFETTSLPEMVDSSTSRCTEVATLEVHDAVASSDGSSMSDAGGVTSILTRRLGLIVGCCMGFIVFVLLVSILGYLKVKKQRETVKRDQQPVPPEYISYRHFSIQSGEAGHAARTAIQEGQHPSFITNVGNSNLNV